MEDEKKDQAQNPEGMEDFYKGLQKVPLKVLDLFIGLCIAALVFVIVMGVMNR